MGHTCTGRREDQRLVTGAGRYAADWDRPGQLHAVFVRAYRAHAVIIAPGTAAAQSAPGVLGDDGTGWSLLYPRPASRGPHRSGLEAKPSVM